MFKNTDMQYGTVAKFIHWLMALLLIAMFVLGYVMTNIPKSNTRFFLYDIHKATGLILLCLIIARIIWRFANVWPSIPATLSRWQVSLAHGNFFLLYLLMLLLPITGFLTSSLGGHPISFYYLFTLAPIAKNPQASSFFASNHEILGYVLIAAFVLHVLGALYHQFILKDHLLKRMWFTGKETV